MKPTDMRAAASLAITVTLLATAACGADDDADRPSTASFCVELQELDRGDDDAGPYAEFYDRHPDPTPDDWAADGHLVTDALEVAIDDIGSVRPSEEAEQYVDDILAALETIKQNSIDMSKAGEAGEQSDLDRLESENQAENVPALMTAMQAIEELCSSAGDPEEAGPGRSTSQSSRASGA